MDESGKRVWKNSELDGARWKERSWEHWRKIRKLRPNKCGHQALERLIEPENEEVSLRYILEYSTRRGNTAEKRTILLQAEKRVRERTGHQERTLKTPLPQQSLPSSRGEESQGVAVEDGRRRRVAFEETARCILRFLEDTVDLKVSVAELQEQLGISEEAGISIKQVAQQARNENGQRFLFFVIFRQGEEDVCIASLARWNAQLKGLVGLERRC